MIIAAVVPAIILLKQVYKADKLEHEPNNLLIGLVLLGIISTSIAIILEQVGTSIIAPLENSSKLTYNFILYFVVVGCSEEFSKYILLKKKTWNHPAFNCSFDGVVYAVFVSLGFALWENLSYVAMYGMSTALVRAVTAIPGHASFGVFMGLFYGLSKKYASNGMPKKAKTYRSFALIMPILLHGSYDFLASMDNEFFGLIFVAFILILFIFSYATVKKMSKDDDFFKREDTYFVPFYWQ